MGGEDRDAADEPDPLHLSEPEGEHLLRGDSQGEEDAVERHRAGKLHEGTADERSHGRRSARVGELEEPFGVGDAGVVGEVTRERGEEGRRAEEGGGAKAPDAVAIERPPASREPPFDSGGEKVGRPVVVVVVVGGDLMPPSAEFGRRPWSRRKRSAEGTRWPGIPPPRRPRRGPPSPRLSRPRVDIVRDRDGASLPSGREQAPGPAPGGDLIRPVRDLDDEFHAGLDRPGGEGGRSPAGGDGGCKAAKSGSEEAGKNCVVVEGT